MDDKANRKGWAYYLGLIIVIIVLIIWIIWGISMFSEYSLVLVTVLIPLGSLILSWYKQRIGGLLIILSGISLIIMLINIPSLKSDDFYFIGLFIIALFVSFPLCIAGIIITIAGIIKTRAKPRKIKS